MSVSLADGSPMRYATLRDLVMMAYQRQDGRLRNDAEITGGPAWLNSDHFDIMAKAEALGSGVDAEQHGRPERRLVRTSSAIIRVPR